MRISSGSIMLAAGLVLVGCGTTAGDGSASTPGAATTTDETLALDEVVSTDAPSSTATSSVTASPSAAAGATTTTTPDTTTLDGLAMQFCDLTHEFAENNPLAGIFLAMDDPVTLEADWMLGIDTVTRLGIVAPQHLFGDFDLLRRRYLEMAAALEEHGWVLQDMAAAFESDPRLSVTAVENEASFRIMTYIDEVCGVDLPLVGEDG